MAALQNSHTLVTARREGVLVGIGNAISDGDAIEFYKSLGFQKAGKTESMWIYAGTEH